MCVCDMCKFSPTDGNIKRKDNNNNIKKIKSQTEASLFSHLWLCVDFASSLICHRQFLTLTSLCIFQLYLSFPTTLSRRRKQLINLQPVNLKVLLPPPTEWQIVERLAVMTTSMLQLRINLQSRIIGIVTHPHREKLGRRQLKDVTLFQGSHGVLGPFIADCGPRQAKDESGACA